MAGIPPAPKVPSAKALSKSGLATATAGGAEAAAVVAERAHGGDGGSTPPVVEMADPTVLAAKALGRAGLVRQPVGGNVDSKDAHKRRQPAADEGIPDFIINGGAPPAPALVEDSAEEVDEAAAPAGDKDAARYDAAHAKALEAHAALGTLIQQHKKAARSQQHASGYVSDLTSLTKGLKALHGELGGDYIKKESAPAPAPAKPVAIARPKPAATNPQPGVKSMFKESVLGAAGKVGLKEAPKPAAAAPAAAPVQEAQAEVTVSVSYKPAASDDATRGIVDSIIFHGRNNGLLAYEAPSYNGKITCHFRSIVQAHQFEKEVKANSAVGETSVSAKAAAAPTAGAAQPQHPAPSNDTPASRPSV